MTNLRVARDTGKLAEFIAEREAAPAGDAKGFNRVLQSMAGKSKEAPEASKPPRSDD